jgi:hypothetical protein
MGKFTVGVLSNLLSYLSEISYKKSGQNAAQRWPLKITLWLSPHLVTNPGKNSRKHLFLSLLLLSHEIKGVYFFVHTVAMWLLYSVLKNARPVLEEMWQNYRSGIVLRPTAISVLAVRLLWPGGVQWVCNIQFESEAVLVHGHRYLKECRRSGGNNPVSLDLSTRWNWTVTFTLKGRTILTFVIRTCSGHRAPPETNFISLTIYIKSWNVKPERNYLSYKLFFITCRFCSLFGKYIRFGYDIFVV